MDGNLKIMFYSSYGMKMQHCHEKTRLKKVPREQLDMIMDVSNSEVSNSGTLDEEVHYVSVNDSRNGSDVE